MLPLEPSAYHDYTSPSDSAQQQLYAVYCGTASRRRTTRGNTLGMVQGRHRHRWRTRPCLRLAWRGWRAEHPGVSPSLASCELGSQSPLVQRSRRLPGKRLTLRKKFWFIFNKCILLVWLFESNKRQNFALVTHMTKRFMTVKIICYPLKIEKSDDFFILF